VHKLYDLIIILTVVYLTVGVVFYLLQNKFIYFPTPKIDHPYKVESLTINQTTIDIIALHKERKKAILYFGGNAEQVAYSAESFSQIFPNHAIYLVNYRGYSGSEGYPDEQLLYSDALHIYDKLLLHHTACSVIGRSIGSSIATYLASKRPISKVILVTPFDSIEHIAQDTLPIYPIKWMLTQKHASIDRVSSINAHTYCILAENDKVVPKKYSQNLINAFPASQRTVSTIPRRGHNSISLDERYPKLLQTYINQ
jgi:pimeloyl-ACP methyl ester carboxylesterase